MHGIKKQNRSYVDTESQLKHGKSRVMFWLCRIALATISWKNIFTRDWVCYERFAGCVL